MRLAERWRWIDRVSPMTVLYVIGLAAANLLPTGTLDANINSLMGNLAIPLAIPLMLMGCDTRQMRVGKALKVFVSGLLSVLVATMAGFFLFKPDTATPEAWREFAQVSAVATGIYTGGIPNMGAIKQAVEMPDQTYLYITSYDLIVTGLYLVFIILFGRQFFRKVLPNRKATASSTTTGADPTAQAARVRPFDREHRKHSLLAIAITLGIAALSYGAALATSHDDSPNMTVLILLLTTLAIGASFLPPMREQQQSFDLGLYCVYVFCLSIATACDVRQMDLAGSLPILYYLGFIILVSLILQIIMARLLHIDGDAVMVCSVALINSPPFVPLAAALLKNKDVIVLGITIGLLGYMLGNYLGIGIFHLLMAIGVR